MAPATVLKQCKSPRHALGAHAQIGHIGTVTASNRTSGFSLERCVMQTRLMITLLITFLICTALVVWFNARGL